MHQSFVGKIVFFAATFAAVISAHASDKDHALIKMVLYKPPSGGTFPTSPSSSVWFALREGESAQCIADGRELQKNGTSRCVVESRSADVTGLIRVSRIDTNTLEVAHGEDVAVLKRIGATPTGAQLGDLNVVGTSIPIDGFK